MKELFLSVVFVLIISLKLSAQVVSATTDSGRKVELYPNGTYMYVDEKKQPTFQDYDCDDYLLKRATGNNNDTVILSELLVLNDALNMPALYVSVGIVSSTVFTLLLTSADDSVCINMNAKIELVLGNGSIYEFNSNNKSNCKGDASVLFGSQYRNRISAVKMATNDIWAITVYANSPLNNIYALLTPDQTLRLRRLLECAVERT